MAAESSVPSRSTTELDLDEIYPFAIQLGKDAGQLLMNGLQRRREQSQESEEQVEKMNAVDIVTEVDHGMLKPLEGPSQRKVSTFSTHS